MLPEVSDGEDRVYYEIPHCTLGCANAKHETPHYTNNMWRCRSYSSGQHTMHYFARHLMACGAHMYEKDAAVEAALGQDHCVIRCVETSKDRRTYRGNLQAVAKQTPKSPERRPTARRRSRTPRRNDDRGRDSTAGNQGDSGRALPQRISLGDVQSMSSRSANTGGEDVVIRKSQLRFLKDTIVRAASATESAATACEQLRAIFDSDERVL